MSSKLARFLLPVISSFLFAMGLFAVDATQYHNSFNELDCQKAFGTFVTLWTAFEAFYRLHPPE